MGLEKLFAREPSSTAVLLHECSYSSPDATASVDGGVHGKGQLEKAFVWIRLSWIPRAFLDGLDFELACYEVATREWIQPKIYE